MSAHTPMRQGFNNGRNGDRFVFVPGCAKPINAGSVERAAFIVRACNAHDELCAALLTMLDRWEPGTIGADRVMWENARAALAKAVA